MSGKFHSLRLPWFLLLILAATASAAEFRVGFASAEITPPVGWRRAGNYTELISTGVNDPLMTKAMVVQDGATTFAFVGNDLCSVPRDLTDLARIRASKLTGIPVANIVITATHTHGGPEYLGPLRQFLHQRALKANNGIDPHEPIDYRRQLIERWAEVIVAAWSNRQPALLDVVIPRLEGVAFNRRYWMKDGSVGWIPRKGDTNIFRSAGPVDTDFPFLLARRVGSKEGLGSLAVFAMHTAVYGGPAFGADFPGHLQTNLSAAFGPKFVSIFGEGCAGDVNHLNPFFTELGIAIKAASPFRRTMVVSLANDLDFYIPTRRAFEEGNYEPTTCPLEPGCGERLVAAAVKLLNELKP